MGAAAAGTAAPDGPGQLQLAGLRAEIATFALAMESRMRATETARGEAWQHMPLRELMQKAQLNLDELRGAAVMGLGVTAAAVDVATYACFLACRMPAAYFGADQVRAAMRFTELGPKEFFEALADELEHARFALPAVLVLRELAEVERRRLLPGHTAPCASVTSTEAATPAEPVP